MVAWSITEVIRYLPLGAPESMSRFSLLLAGDSLKGTHRLDGL